MSMINGCGNCANFVWGDNKTPLPSECVTCTTTHVPNGQHPTPSHWKAKPQTKADRIRAMSDEELAERIYYGFDVQFCSNAPECAAMLNADEGIPEAMCKECALKWLKQPAEEETT